MEIVVDTNVIISALLKKGTTRKILLLAPFKFYTVPYTKLEIEKHKDELMRKAGIDRDTFQYLLDRIFDKIEIVESEIIKPYKERAIELMKDMDISDAPFIALALHLKCAILSNDRHLKHQKSVKIFTIEEILELF